MSRHPGAHLRSERFTFTTRHYDPATGVLGLGYDADGLGFEETLTFPWQPWPTDASRQAAFLRATEVLHLVAGISYYKAGLAPDISVQDCSLDEPLCGFLNGLYAKGLGEFAHVNQLDLTTLPLFQVNGVPAPGAVELDLPERALVAMGGGKDSLVCLEMLRGAGIEVQPVCVGGAELIGETVKAASLPLIRIGRRLAPQLAELNARGAWNGHVPVTAINSAVIVCAALLYGYRYVVFANESSADEATLTTPEGLEVNHQYSKSLAFEQAFRTLLRRRVSPSIDYFSLLRPFGEVAVAKRFAALPRYHAVFSSCNRNFHQDGAHISGRWCGNCPKCRFTALVLAPFLSPAELNAIQGVDLLDQETQIEGFAQLCGLEQDKPFECVGSIAESRALVKHLSRQPLWRDKAVIGALAGAPAVCQAGGLTLQPDPGAAHCIPDALMAVIDAF